MAKRKKTKKIIGRKSDYNKIIGPASFSRGGKDADNLLGTGGKKSLI